MMSSSRGGSLLLPAARRDLGIRVSLRHKGSTMKHLALLSKRPERAQADICTSISSDYQALLCFLVQVLETIFPTLAEAKTPTQSDA